MIKNAFSLGLALCAFTAAQAQDWTVKEVEIDEKGQIKKIDFKFDGKDFKPVKAFTLQSGATFEEIDMKIENAMLTIDGNGKVKEKKAGIKNIKDRKSDATSTPTTFLADNDGKVVANLEYTGDQLTTIKDQSDKTLATLKYTERKMLASFTDSEERFKVEYTQDGKIGAITVNNEKITLGYQENRLASIKNGKNEDKYTFAYSDKGVSSVRGNSKEAKITYTEATPTSVEGSIDGLEVSIKGSAGSALKDKKGKGKDDATQAKINELKSKKMGGGKDATAKEGGENKKTAQDAIKARKEKMTAGGERKKGVKKDPNENNPTKKD